jgi:hypothetical protein
LLLKKEKIMITDNNGNITIIRDGEGENEVTFKSRYYLESQLELFEYRMNDEQLSENERRYYKEKYNSIMEKINKRKNENIQGE